MYGPCKAKGLRRRLKDCTQCPTEQKKALLDAYYEEKNNADATPAQSTRPKTKEENKTTGRLHKTDEEKTWGRIHETSTETQNTPSMTIRIEDGDESLKTVGPTDDGSDESIVSLRLAEKAVLEGIGRKTKIQSLSLQVALKEDDDAQSFTFSRAWTPPRIVLRLSTGPLALTNVKFLVADADLAAEDILIGLPVLRHLGVDTRTMLERDRKRLDGSDCSVVSPPAKGGSVSRLMIARHNLIIEEPVSAGAAEDTMRPRVDYFESKEEEDPFPDESLLN